MVNFDQSSIQLLRKGDVPYTDYGYESQSKDCQKCEISILILEPDLRP